MFFYVLIFCFARLSCRSWNGVDFKISITPLVLEGKIICSDLCWE